MPNLHFKSLPLGNGGIMIAALEIKLKTGKSKYFQGFTDAAAAALMALNGYDMAGHVKKQIDLEPVLSAFKAEAVLDV